MACAGVGGYVTCVSPPRHSCHIHFRICLCALCALVHTGPNLKAEHKVPWGFWLPNPAISKSDGILIELFGEVFCACYDHKRYRLNFVSQNLKTCKLAAGANLQTCSVCKLANLQTCFIHNFANLQTCSWVQTCKLAMSANLQTCKLTPECKVCTTASLQVCKFAP